MMKIKIKLVTLLGLTWFVSLFTQASTAVPMTTQDKLFTLEDLNFGGTNYRNMQPQNLFLTWWGDQLMYQDVEEGGTIDAKGERHKCFDLDHINFLMTASDDKDKRVMHSAFNAQYPYPDQPLVLLKNSHWQILYN